MALPDLNALKVAFRGKLVADATLMTLVGGVWNGVLPAQVDWALPQFEYGVQADPVDEANGYGEEGRRVVLRLMAFERGYAGGVGAYDRCYAALNRAHAVLGNALSVSGQSVWSVRWVGGVPEASPPDVDDETRPRLQVGAMYECRTV
jgi:hypothetical protein